MTTLKNFVKTIGMQKHVAFFILLTLGMTNSLWAKDACKKRHLVEKDCYLTLGKNKIQVWRDKIFLNNKGERDTQTLPLPSAEIDASSVEWSFVYGYEMKGHFILELGLWQPSQDLSDVETLMWIVYEVQKGSLLQQLKKSIQKRKKLKSGKYKLDRILTHGLVFKNHKTTWYVGRKKGSFK